MTFRHEGKNSPSKTDNPATLFWQRKDSATSQLLCLFGIHQKYHGYVPLYAYISGISIPIAHDASCLFHLADEQLLLTYLLLNYLQKESLQLVTVVSPPLLSGTISALWNKSSNMAFLLLEPAPSAPILRHGTTSQLKWALIEAIETKCKSYSTRRQF